MSKMAVRSKAVLLEVVINILQTNSKVVNLGYCVEVRQIIFFVSQKRIVLLAFSVSWYLCYTDILGLG